MSYLLRVAYGNNYCIASADGFQYVADRQT